MSIIVGIIMGIMCAYVLNQLDAYRVRKGWTVSYIGEKMCELTWRKWYLADRRKVIEGEQGNTVIDLTQL